MVCLYQFYRLFSLLILWIDWIDWIDWILLLLHRILENAMAKILKVKNVKDYSSWLGHTDSHQLVSIINYEKVSPVRHTLNDYSVYGIFFS